MTRKSRYSARRNEYTKRERETEREIEKEDWNERRKVGRIMKYRRKVEKGAKERTKKAAKKGWRARKEREWRKVRAQCC